MRASGPVLMAHALLVAASIGAIGAQSLAQSMAQSMAQSAAQQAKPAPEGSFAVRCGTLHLGDGSEPLRDAWLVIVDGKVQRASREAPPSDLPVVDCSQKVVMPGIVAVDSDLGDATDTEYQVSPDALAVDAFDFDRTWRAALEGGVTTAYLSPGRLRLVSGQGAVVKLAGTDIVARILTENACLRVNFGDQALQAPRVFEPPTHATDEDPLLPSRIQLPTSRISVLAELRALFASSADADAALAGEGPAQHRYDLAPLRAVVAGTLPVRAAASRGAEIRQALALQQELGLRLVLEDPQEIAAVASAAAAQKVMATFRVPVRLGQSNPGGEDRLDPARGPHFDAPAHAARAGMVFGLVPSTDVPLRDYLMAVAIAVRHGLPTAAALRSVGLDAARVLGVDNRVGALTAGKDADFVVLSGDPLAVGSMVESTWIDGRRVFVRQHESQVLAVRAGRVLDGTGRVYRNGVVLVQDGRIKGVGEELAIPYGAQILDVPHGVVTPGFVDAFSHLGLAGEGTGVPNGQARHLLHEAIVHDDPMFEPALAEGLTTVLVAGKDGGLVSGRIAAIKTGAADHQGMIVREIAGLRVVFDAIGPNAINPLADLVARGKMYVAAWDKYEKDLQAYREGKKPEAQAAPAPAPEAKTEDDPITGVWEAEVNIQDRVRIKIALDLKRDGTKVTGTIQISFAGRELPAQPISSGSFENGKLRLEFRGMGGSATLEGTVQGETLTGTMSLGPAGEQPVTATRTSKTSGGGGGSSSTSRRAAAKAPTGGEPKAPKVDDNMEPMRAVLQGRATLVVKVDRAAAITSVVELLEKEKVSYALHGAEDLLDDIDLLGGKRPTVLVGPEVVVEDKAKLRNTASTFADHGLPIAFATGDCAGSRYLPLHAAYAVRYGLSPSDALAALTIWPARAFHVADRVGSLEKGKDADLVVFSADPFEPQSRVVLVVCNGRVVVDRRNTEAQKQ
jgi:imidazolonepropionase-like amidohydrolase